MLPKSLLVPHFCPQQSSFLNEESTCHEFIVKFVKGLHKYSGLNMTKLTVDEKDDVGDGILILQLEFIEFINRTHLKNSVLSHFLNGPFLARNRPTTVVYKY